MEVALGYTAEMAVEEAQRCLNCKNKPCVTGCPVQVQDSGVHRAGRRGQVPRSACQVIKETSALPAVCGRVCPQETPVREPSACAASRASRWPSAVWSALWPTGTRTTAPKQPVKPESNGHKVAVVGAGPAGLTCAGDLAQMGYDVTVFEALHTAGGVLVYGIPEFRLPKAIVQKEVDDAEGAGR